MRSKRAFLFDRMLGSLCRKMRLLGYDCELLPEGETGRFLVVAEREDRIAVTRARRHSDRPGKPAVVLKKETVKEQIIELFETLGEAPRFEPFTRCLECNELLVEHPPAAVKGNVPPYIERTFTLFHRCPGCGRLYWEGSHYQAMAEEIREIEGVVNGIFSE
jgi:uncharacterized protein with PIN domain